MALLLQRRDAPTLDDLARGLYKTSVAGFQWRYTGAYETPDRRCPALSDASAVTLPVSISLGQSRAAVRAALGPPTTEYGSVWLYFHSHKESNSRGTLPFTVDNSLTVLFRGDTVEAIEAGRSSTD
jgi:hypothetical protein